MGIKYLERACKAKLAYVLTPAKDEQLPYVMFLGGFKSDMNGKKAAALEQFCKERGQGFIRFDYTGHGQSGGAFKDGTISLWKEDALDILSLLPADKGVILVGSSMGGWISLKILTEGNERIKGLVGIAAAPDFTASVLERMTPQQHNEIRNQGYFEISNDYSDDPYIFTKDLLDDGSKNFVLNKTTVLAVPMTLLQGKMDFDVPWQTVGKIKTAFPTENFEIVLVEDGDHSLSRPEDLQLLNGALTELMKKL